MKKSIILIKLSINLYLEICVFVTLLKDALKHKRARNFMQYKTLGDNLLMSNTPL